MHPKDNLLHAYADHELSDTQAKQLREHLLHCPGCQARLTELTARSTRVRAQLDPLAPRPYEQPRSAQVAYKRFMNNSRLMNQQKETFKTMFTRRPFWAAISIFIVLVLVFSLTPASAWASSFLGLFRVQKVQVVTFDPAAAENARTQLNANSQAIEQIFKEDMKVNKHGSGPVQVASAAEAAQKAGFTPRLPADLPDAKISVEPGMNATFTINQSKLQALFDAVGANVQLPKEVDGKAVTVDVPDGVVASSGCPANVDGFPAKDAAQAAQVGQADAQANCTVLVQLPSPVVNAPDQLDMVKLGTAMFTFLGVPQDEAAQLSERIDWTSTLVVPIPQGGSVQYQDVKVDGVSGTTFQETGRNSYAIVWVKDGVLYGLRGPGSTADGLKVANSLK